MLIVAPRLAGSDSDGLFNLERPAEAHAFVEFLNSVCADRDYIRSTCRPRKHIASEHFWRADGDMRYGEFGLPGIGGVVAWRDHVKELRSVVWYLCCLPATTLVLTHRTVSNPQQ